MPIYDYICSNCTTRTEFIHGIEAPSPRFCPTCGAEGTLRKALVAPVVHFKGSGWAKKDRTSSSSTKTKAAAGGSGDGSTGGSNDSGGAAGSTDSAASTKATDSSGKKSAPTSSSSGD